MTRRRKQNKSKLPKTVSLNDMKTATVVLTSGTVKEFRKILTCSEFAVDDVDDEDEPSESFLESMAQSAANEIGKLVTCSSFAVEEPSESEDDSDDDVQKDNLDDVNGGNDVEVIEADERSSLIAAKYMDSPKLEIKNFHTAALVLSKGCKQELRKLVSCSEFTVKEDDSDSEPEDPDKADVAPASQQQDPHYPAREESTSTELDTQSETLANSRKNSRKQPREHRRKSKANVTRSPSIVVTKCESVEVEIHDTGKTESRRQSRSTTGTSSSKHESRRSSAAPDSAQKQSKLDAKSEKSEFKPKEGRRHSSTIDDANPVIHESEYLTAPTSKSRSESLNSEERSGLCDSMYNRSGRSPSLRSVATTTEIRDEVTQTTPIEGFKEGRKTDALKPVMRYEPARSSFKKMQARRSGGREYGWLPKEHEEEAPPVPPVWVQGQRDQIYASETYQGGPVYEEIEERTDRVKKKRRSKDHQSEINSGHKHQKQKHSHHHLNAHHSTSNKGIAHRTNEQLRDAKMEIKVEPPTPPKRRDVSVNDLLEIVSGMLNEVTGSLERLNRCVEKSASMNGTPIQSPIPMRRKYRLLNQCKTNMDNKSGNPNSIGISRGEGESGSKKRDTSSLPRNFYIRLKEKESNDCSSLFSNSRTSGTSDTNPSDDADGSQRSSCSNYGTEEQGPDDNLRVVLLKRRMYEKYPHCFPTGPPLETSFGGPTNGDAASAIGDKSQHGTETSNYDLKSFKSDRDRFLSNTHVVTFQSSGSEDNNDTGGGGGPGDGSIMSPDEYYSQYIIAPRGVQSFTAEIDGNIYGTNNDDSTSNFYEVID